MTAPEPRARGALVVVAALCMGYVLSQFYRSSIGVIGPELIRGMALSAEALGVLGGTFFLVFGLSQIPLGVMLDRFGPRRVNTGLLLVAACGALIFAAAQDAGVLALGRGIMGLGCAAGLMGSLVVYSRWFTPRQFSAMAGFTLGIGGLGNLAATTPLAIAAEAVGWRGAFVAAAAVTVLVAMLIWLGVRDTPPGRSFHDDGARENLADSLKGVATVLTNRQLHFLLPMNTVGYASIMAVLGLWGAPFLTDVHGLEVVTAADILMLMSVAAMLGSFGYGWLGSRLGAHKRVVVLGALAVCAIYVWLAFGLPMSVSAIALLFGLVGFLGGYAVLLISHVRSLFPERLVGRGLTAANLFSFGGVAVVQMICGVIVGAWPAGAGGARSPDAYQAMFGFLAVIIAAAVLVYWFSREPQDRNAV